VLYPAFEPDFVGELFVLRLIDPTESHPDFRGIGLGERKPAQLIMDAAWAHGLNAPEFLTNIADDFASHHDYGFLIVELAKVCPAQDKLEAWLSALAQVALRFAMAGRGIELNNVVSIVEGIAKQRPELAAYLAMTIFAGGLTSEVEHLSLAAVGLTRLRNVYSNHRDNAAVREWLAKGLFNRSVDLVERQSPADLPGAVELLAELRVLSQAHPHDAAVRDEFGKTLAFMAYAYASHNACPQAQDCIQQLDNMQAASELDTVWRKLGLTLSDIRSFVAEQCPHT
jgi:hypothetical protein